jgi:acetoin utilization protein AcuB
MRVREQMSTAVVSVLPHDPVGPALHLMESSKLRCLPVVEDRRLVGLLLASDARLSTAPPEAQVLEYMRPPNASIHPDTLIERAAWMMLEHDVRGLPVVDAQQRLVGVLTVQDLLRTLVETPPVVLWK